MKIGDLVRVKNCPTAAEGYDNLRCQCFFCASDSNRIGVVTGPAPRNQWHVMFDTGAWRLDDFDIANGDAEVISESR